MSTDNIKREKNNAVVIKKKIDFEFLPGHHNKEKKKLNVPQHSFQRIEFSFSL